MSKSKAFFAITITAILVLLTACGGSSSGGSSTGSTPPDAPSNLSLELTLTDEVTVSFNDNSVDEEIFTIAYSLDGFSTSRTVNVMADIAEKVITGLDYDADYEFKVRSVNIVGESNWTNIESISTLPLMNGWMNLNAGFPTSKSDTVYSNSGIDYATDMRIKINDDSFSSWETYVTPKAIDITSQPDGVLNIVVEYRDSAGGVIGKSASVLVDRVDPVINSVLINGGVIGTSTRLVNLSIDVEGATKMIVSGSQVIFNQFTTWSDYDSEMEYNLPYTSSPQTIYFYFSDEVGNIVSTSRTIMYLPNEEAMSIDTGREYTITEQVELTLTSTSAAQMMIKNSTDTTEVWQAYSNLVSDWDLDSGEGIKTVEVSFKDTGGNITGPFSDSITVDTIAPTLQSVEINTGDATAYNRNAITRYSTNGNAVRFKINGEAWSSWEGVSGIKSTPLFDDGDEVINEDEMQLVEIEVKDLAGNITASSDTIIFDEVTVLQVSVNKISVQYDGDSVGSGEWKWRIDYTSSYHNSWWLLEAGSVSIDSGEQYHINETVIMTIINDPANSWSLRWNVIEEDFYDHTVGKFTEVYSYPYETGLFEKYISSAEGRGTCYWSITRIDL